MRRRDIRANRRSREEARWAAFMPEEDERRERERDTGPRREQNDDDYEQRQMLQ